MNYSFIIVGLTFILVTFEFAYCTGASITINNTTDDMYKNNSLWTYLLISTISAGISGIIGIWNTYKNIVDGFDLNNKRLYDVYNVFTGMAFFITSLIIMTYTDNYQLDVLFKITYIFQIIKMIFSSFPLFSSVVSI
jgi:hypothetical protein